MPPRLRKEEKDKRKENSHTRAHLMPLWTPFSEGGCRRADSCGFNRPRLQAGFEECFLLLCAAGTHMKDDRGERERHKPFPPSLRSKEKQNLPAPPSKETPRGQVCRKNFLFLHSKMSGLTSAQCFDNVGPKARVFTELSGTIKSEHVLARIAPVPHTLSPMLPRSRAPSTAAPYQRLARCCLTQSFVELLSPLFNLLLRLFPVGLSSKFVHPLFPIYLPACSVSSNVPSVNRNTPGTLVVFHVTLHRGSVCGFQKVWFRM